MKKIFQWCVLHSRFFPLVAMGFFLAGLFLHTRYLYNIGMFFMVVGAIFIFIDLHQIRKGYEEFERWSEEIKRQWRQQKDN